MALVTIKLQHVEWRDGRPKFKPGPTLRRLGFSGKSLRHYGDAGEPGAWFTLEETRAFLNALDPRISAARESRPYRPGKPASRKVLLYTVKDLFEDFFASPRFSGRVTVDGRRSERPLAPATVRDYRGKARALEGYDPELWLGAADALTTPILFGLYEELWRDKGLTMARGMLAVLSAALSWGLRRGKVRYQVNPALRLGMETPEPRIRVGEIAEMHALVNAAHAIGRPEIGDSVRLGLWTGQRQTDRIALVDAGLANGRRIFRQSKTGAIVAIREAPELEAALAAARERRKGWKVQPLEQLVIMDETAKAPFKPDHYRHVFADVRAAAVKDCPSLESFQERDLRDTAVTWMALGGSTVPEIIAVTGHSAPSAHAILKHYLARHPELADAAIAKMVAWYDEKGATTS